MTRERESERRDLPFTGGAALHKSALFVRLSAPEREKNNPQKTKKKIRWSNK